jgi:hypothetical protein
MIPCVEVLPLGQGQTWYIVVFMFERFKYDTQVTIKAHRPLDFADYSNRYNYR